MNKSEAGFTLIEAMIVVAVSAILLAVTVPLSAFWTNRADISTAKGELSHGFGKAISLALRNEQALPIGEPAAALCLAPDNQLTVLEPSPSELPNCSANTGNMVWRATIPESISMSSNGNNVSCMCFNTAGLLTNNNCGGCSVTPTIDVGVGNEMDTVHVR